jgi:uncharacterized membrane protein (UPF0127 family)
MATIPRFDRFAAAQFLAACAFAALFAFTARADQPLRTQQIKVGPHALRVEVAMRDEELQQGLMFREKLGKNDGMLFIFPETAYHSMWMKNTLIPLSVAFVDAGGTILNILDMEPGSLDSHMSAGPSIYAIETNRGWFAEKKVKPGDRVTGLPSAAKSSAR